MTTMQSPQASANTPAKATPKPWAPPAVIDDNSSAFARYAASHKAFVGSNPPSRTSSSALSSQGQGSRQLSVTERMLAGQRLNSNRLKSQELPDFEPSEELADDEEAPQGRRSTAAAHLPDMPFQRTGSTASRRSQSFDLGQRKMSGQLGTKTGRRLSTTERMLSGQRLESQRLASQELPEQEPGDGLAEDDEPPPEQRRRSIGHPPTVPPDSLYRPRWAQRMTEQSEKPRQLPHILSGIELQMNLELDDMARTGFKPEEDTIPEGLVKPSPFDAAKLDPFSSESEDEAGLHRPGGMRTQRTQSEADKTLAHKRLDAQKIHKDFEPSESLADDDEIPFDPAGHQATRKSFSISRPPKSVPRTQVSAKRQPSMTDRMLVGQRLNSKEIRDDDVRRPSIPKPASRAASSEMKTRPSSRQGSCKMSITSRMLSGQLLHSQRLASQHLPDYEPSEEMPDDYVPSPIAAA